MTLEESLSMIKCVETRINSFHTAIMPFLALIKYLILLQVTSLCFWFGKLRNGITFDVAPNIHTGLKAQWNL